MRDGWRWHPPQECSRLEDLDVLEPDVGVEAAVDLKGEDAFETALGVLGEVHGLDAVDVKDDAVTVKRGVALGYQSAEKTEPASAGSSAEDSADRLSQSGGNCPPAKKHQIFVQSILLPWTC